MAARKKLKITYEYRMFVDGNDFGVYPNEQVAYKLAIQVNKATGKEVRVIRFGKA